MSLVKWSRPEITVAKTVNKRIHVSRSINWRDVLAVVGRFEMDLRRKHAEIRATDRRSLNGTVRVVMNVDRKGLTTVQSATADPSIEDLLPHVVHCLNQAKFPESDVEVEVSIQCVFDHDTVHTEDPFARAGDLFDEPDDDPFANPYAATVPTDESGFGDPF